MKQWIGIFVLSTSLGSAAWANNSGVPSEDQVKAYMKHLNTYFNNPALNVRAKNNLRNQEVRKATNADLQKLEGYLHGDFELDDAALKQLSCGRPVCDGGEMN